MIYALPLILLITAAGDGALTCDPVLTALFTPLRPHVGRYEVCTTDARLEETGSEAIEALDAFGLAGPYDRAKLARLYGGTRARIARSWTGNGAEIVSITRISPYPDATFSRLNPGTLEIRFTVSRGAIISALP
jgi:hypothetical protein